MGYLILYLHGYNFAWQEVWEKQKTALTKHCPKSKKNQDSKAGCQVEHDGTVGVVQNGFLVSNQICYAVRRVL